MSLTAMSKIQRLLGIRGFADPELEREFQKGFRSFGVRFLYIASMLAACSFMAFWLIDGLSGRRGVLDDTQLIRFSVSVLFLVVGQLVQHFTPFFTRHYTATCFALVGLSTLVAGFIAYSAQINAPAILAYWALPSCWQPC